MNLDLHSHVRWCTRLQWSMGGLLVAIMLAFYLAGYRPQIKRLESLQGDIHREQAQLLDNQTRTRLLPAIAADVNQLRNRVDQSKQLPPQNALPQFLKDITQLGQRSSLTGFAVKPGLPTHGDLFNQMPVTLNFDGRYPDVFDFLRGTEEMKRMTRIGEMSIKDVQGRPGQVEVQLSMNLYFEPD